MDKYQTQQRHGFGSWRDSKWAEKLEFFGSFLRRPATVGALAPSSRALASAMVQGMDFDRPCVVVELGAGTGAFTESILGQVDDRSVFFALEVDASSVERLRRRFPHLAVYHDSAERIPEYLSRHGKQQADYIISGLPWTTLPAPVERGIWQAVLNSLAPDGVFATFSYLQARWLPRGIRFRRRLRQHFRSVEISPIVWGNLPPAFVYRCRHRI